MSTNKQDTVVVRRLKSVIHNNAPALESTLNAAVGAQELPGIRPIPAGSGYSAIEKAFRAALLSKLEKEWSIQFPKRPKTNNHDFGFFLAPEVLNLKMKIPYAAEQISMDFMNWGITAPPGTAETIINSVMLNLILKGDIVATSHGHKSLDAINMLGWACATITGQAGAEHDNVHLIGYVFAAENIPMAD